MYKKDSFIKRFFRIFSRKKENTAKLKSKNAISHHPKKLDNQHFSDTKGTEKVKNILQDSTFNGDDSPTAAKTVIMDSREIFKETDFLIKKEKSKETLVNDSTISINNIPKDKVSDDTKARTTVKKDFSEANEFPIPDKRKFSLFEDKIGEEDFTNQAQKSDDNEITATQYPQEILSTNEQQQIIVITRKRFPVLVKFMENLLGWIEENLGSGLLTRSLQQLYVADAEFELEPDDFLLRFLEGLQINNLNPLIKIIRLRAESLLDKENSEKIINAVTLFERQIRIERLVDAFPWQKKRAAMRKILEKVWETQQNNVYNELEKTTREKTKEKTIRKWLEFIAQPGNFEPKIYTKLSYSIKNLQEEFRKSTAETQVLVFNIEEMMVKAERDKVTHNLVEIITKKLNDLQERKTKLLEIIFILLEELSDEQLKKFKDECQKAKEFDVFSLLLLLLPEVSSLKEEVREIFSDIYAWREELRIKEALKRMYFISKAFNHDQLTRSLLVFGCLTENNTESYRKKVKKIKLLYGFNLHKHLMENPFNPNSTKASTPNKIKYTLQYEQIDSGEIPREEMILYKGGTILAKLVIPLKDKLIEGTKPNMLKESSFYLQRSAYCLETMISFYNSFDQIKSELKKEPEKIWNKQGLKSLNRMIGNNQREFLQLSSKKFGVQAVTWHAEYNLSTLVGNLIDDIFIPLSSQVNNVLNF